MELLRAREIILSPCLTEKNTAKKDIHQYAFSVDRRANKIDIKQAVEAIFQVKVLKVNTSHVQGKNKKVRLQMGRTSAWKKAMVTLRPEDKIEFV